MFLRALLIHHSARRRDELACFLESLAMQVIPVATPPVVSGRMRASYSFSGIVMNRSARVYETLQEVEGQWARMAPEWATEAVPTLLFPPVAAYARYYVDVMGPCPRQLRTVSTGLTGGPQRCNRATAMTRMHGS